MCSVGLTEIHFFHSTGEVPEALSIGESIKHLFIVSDVVHDVKSVTKHTVDRTVSKAGRLVRKVKKEDKTGGNEEIIGGGETIV